MSSNISLKKNLEELIFEEFIQIEIAKPIYNTIGFPANLHITS